MKNKTSIQLMEQVVMTGVFVLAAAICLQAYAASYAISKTSELREAAARIASDMTERFTAGGAIDDAPAYYADLDGNACGRKDAAFRVNVTRTGQDGDVIEIMTVKVTGTDGNAAYASRTTVRTPSTKGVTDP